MGDRRGDRHVASMFLIVMLFKTSFILKLPVAGQAYGLSGVIPLGGLTGVRRLHLGGDRRGDRHVADRLIYPFTVGVLLWEL